MSNSLRYTYIDGDNIGLKIEASFMNNDEASLQDVNNAVKNTVGSITSYLTSHSQQIIFSGADGIICKGVALDLDSLLNMIRSINNGITFSIGMGLSLRDCYIALRYAKSINKNIAVTFENEIFRVTGKNEYSV